MSNLKVLYTSTELHNAIRGVLGSPSPNERRVALVAYAGKNAHAFLLDPKDLEIVCALEPSATSAETLIRLRERGAEISQSDRLHMKVYWSSKKGAVICSANASANALGRRGLKEAGVWIPKGAVDIQKLLRYARPHSIRDSDLKALARESDQIQAARPRRQTRVHDESPTLRDWLASGGRKDWDLGWWDASCHVAKAAKTEAISHYGVGEPADFLTCKRNYHSPGDWVLTFNVEGGKSASWMYVDFVVKVPRSDKRAFYPSYPYQAAQVHPSSLYPAPPFRLDSQARKVIAAAVKGFGRKQFEKMRTARVPSAFRQLLKAHVRSTQGTT
ncbi:MAG: phospholipase D family protein [Acidobacteriaceae bacterium]|nr:phospholipase D family protein [Acidobacteriaceae bacterium]